MYTDSTTSVRFSILVVIIATVLIGQTKSSVLVIAYKIFADKHKSNIY